MLLPKQRYLCNVPQRQSESEQSDDDLGNKWPLKHSIECCDVQEVEFGHGEKSTHSQVADKTKVIQERRPLRLAYRRMQKDPAKSEFRQVEESHQTYLSMGHCSIHQKM